jgi:hypothetical protein
LDGESVKNLERIIAQAQYTEVDGMKFCRDASGNVSPLIFEPHPDPVIIHTLTGFVDYIKANVDKLDYEKHLIVVESPCQVVLYSAIGGKRRKRDTILNAELDKGLRTYQFGQYQEVEPFVISLNSLFEESEDRERLIRYVSKVRGGTNFSLGDDGVTQIAEVAKGVSGALTGKETAPKIVKLKPFRIFRDVEQPESEFLFRLKLLDPSESHIVGACLYEADGGRWRNAAILAIKDYLQERVEVSIIA